MAQAPVDLLRAGLLVGQVVATAGAPPDGEIAAACATLGAATPVLDAPLLDEDAVMRAAAALGSVDTLVCDAAPAFAAAGGGLTGLCGGLDGAWNATRAVANAAWLRADGGKLVVLAPRPGAGARAGALAAALENLARTLSVEWARYGIRTSAILPGDGAADEVVATLVAYLASPAGDYFSGCAFTPRGSELTLLAGP